MGSTKQRMINEFEKPSEEDMTSKFKPNEKLYNNVIKVENLSSSQHLQENQHNMNFNSNTNQNCNIGDNKVVNFVNNITVNVSGAISLNSDTKKQTQMNAKKDKLSKNIKKLNTSNEPTNRRMVKARDISASKRTDSPTKTESTCKTDSMTSDLV